MTEFSKVFIDTALFIYCFEDNEYYAEIVESNCNRSKKLKLLPWTDLRKRISDKKIVTPLLCLNHD